MRFRLTERPIIFDAEPMPEGASFYLRVSFLVAAYNWDNFDDAFDDNFQDRYCIMAQSLIKKQLLNLDFITAIKQVRPYFEPYCDYDLNDSADSVLFSVDLYFDTNINLDEETINRLDLGEITEREIWLDNNSMYVLNYRGLDSEQPPAAEFICTILNTISDVFPEMYKIMSLGSSLNHIDPFDILEDVFDFSMEEHK